MEDFSTFANHLERDGHVKSPRGRSVHVDQNGLWGCDEYGSDCFLGEATPAGLHLAFAWQTSASANHPAEFAYP